VGIGPLFSCAVMCIRRSDFVYIRCRKYLCSQELIMIKIMRFAVCVKQRRKSGLILGVGLVVTTLEEVLHRCFRSQLH
jgi:hypothetical protein